MQQIHHLISRRQRTLVHISPSTALLIPRYQVNNMAFRQKSTSDHSDPHILVLSIHNRILRLYILIIHSGHRSSYIGSSAPGGNAYKHGHHSQHHGRHGGSGRAHHHHHRHRRSHHGTNANSENNRPGKIRLYGLRRPGKIHVLLRFINMC